MSSIGNKALTKLPEVTLGFWIIKVLATTLGETAGDAVTMSLNLGYWIGSAIFAAIFAVAVSAQIRAREFHPFQFWGVIIATTTFGTTLADLFDRSLGIGYTGGATILFACVVGTLVIWHRTLGSIAVDRLASRPAEIFYWVTVMFSQTLGTALGDWTADTTGLGYEGGAIVFAIALGVVAVLYFKTRISRALLFWAAFVLTRPLGATLGDLLDKPRADGGLALDRFVASAVIGAIIIAFVALLPQRAERRNPD
jgi:uncharacterized membrane-anchored protein